MLLRGFPLRCTLSARMHFIRPHQRREPGFLNGQLRLALLVLVLVTGCRTVPRLAPVNLQEPGWIVRTGQAVWKRGRRKPEVAGEILLATRPDGRAFIQLSKSPFPLIIAQSTAQNWQAEIPMENKRYAGRGQPPERLLLLYLPRALAGQPLPKGWSWQKLENDGWRLQNPSRGESLAIYFAQ